MKEITFKASFETEEQIKAMKIPLKSLATKTSESPYNTEFVKELRASKNDIKNGRCKEFNNMDGLQEYLKTKK